MAKITVDTLMAHEAAAVVKTLFTVSGIPVQQQEVAAVLEVSPYKAFNLVHDALRLKLIYNMETRKYQASQLVPFSALKLNTPKAKEEIRKPKPKTKATPADDTRLGWLF